MRKAFRGLCILSTLLFPIALILAGLAGVTPAWAGNAADACAGTRDLALVNGKIHTMDEHNSIVSAVTIKDGRVSTVGQGAKALGPCTKMIDLKGRTVVPGMIDNHIHTVLMGNRPGYHTPLENAYSIADVQATLAARAAGVPAGAFITTIGGFHFNQFADTNPRRLPTLAELDIALPNHPVYISISFSGPSTTNSLGKAFFTGHGVTVGADGSIATGNSTSGRALLALRQTLLDFEARRRGALDALGYGVSLGLTTHLDQGAFQATNTESDGAAHEDNYTMHLPFLALNQEGKLPARLRINFLHMETDDALPGLRARLQNAFQFFGDDMVRTGGIGEFVAQGLGPRWVDASRLVAQARWRAEVHSLSRTDFQTEISGWETVNNEFPITDLRWVIAHVPFITEDWVNRLKALGGGLSLTGWRYLAGTAVNNGPPFRMIVNNGIRAGMGGDGMQIAPMNPWIHIYYAVTGKNARGELINDGQQISRLEALRLYTSRNGWFLREEDKLGSIEVGKLGDLVVLSDDYFNKNRVSDEDIKRLSSVLTIVGGMVVHDAGVLE